MKKEKLEFSILGFPLKRAIFNKSWKEWAQRLGPLACKSIWNEYENSEWQSSTCRQIIQTPISGQRIFHLFGQGVFYFQLRCWFRGYQNSTAQAAPFQESAWLTVTHNHGWPLAASKEPPRDEGQGDHAPACPLDRRTRFLSMSVLPVALWAKRQF